MMRLQVIVNALYKRNRLPVQWPDVDGIAGVVLEGFSFIGDEVSPSEIPNPAPGKWYRDRDGYFYWGGGLLIIDEFIAPPIEPVSKDLTEEITGNKDWGFIDFKIGELWKHSKGENIKVAILDSGLNFNLGDFKNKTNITYFNADTNSTNQVDCLDNDQTGHGTNCTAMLCAQGDSLLGVAPEVSLFVIRITNANGDRTFPAVLNGLSRAIDLQCDVISMSFSYSKNAGNAIQLEEMNTLMERAVSLDLTVVAAVGDSGDLPFPVDDFPASFPDCLSIGGIDKSRKRSRYSTMSTFLDLMGPGEDLIAVAHPNKPVSGTSFSTPFVAGIIALLKSIARAQGKVLTTSQLNDLLKRSADRNISNYNVLEHGFGIIDPVAALKLIQSL
jgi:subtilisin family serine protease